MYLEGFALPDRKWEEKFLNDDVRMLRTDYTSFYPFKIFPEKRLGELRFAPVTFFYGGNGSGKTTLLNLIAEKLQVERGTYFNRSAFFGDYVERCEYRMQKNSPKIPKGSRIITSDDVFEYLLDIRCMNEGVDEKREDLFNEYLDEKYSTFKLKSLEDYQKIKRNNDAKRLTASKYVKGRVMLNLPEKSNGESAFFYFTEHIKENALYLLDEPENSLAVGLQLQLQKFLEDSARYFHCQFIIATHSPFLLSIKDAVIYDLDTAPAQTKRWTELNNVRQYFDFFEKHKAEFERG